MSRDVVGQERMAKRAEEQKLRATAAAVKSAVIMARTFAAVYAILAL